MRDENTYKKATSILRELYGENARFRDGQYEAIEATLHHHRTLVVQRTGWGKSLVYFICTKILREQSGGLTVVVSPLLVLMENQIEAAEKLNLNCDALNSQTKDRREEILETIAVGKQDIIFVTPETLFQEDVQKALPQWKIGLFVVDEAHCISDWGHDFRLEYSRLREVIEKLPESVPLLATTATANDRVVDDLTKQLGDDLYVSRGPLSRDSLHIQVLNIPRKIDRYAWILANIQKLPGSGIIYCLTQRDCDYLSDFLIKNGISALPYYSGNDEIEARNRDAEWKLRNNKIKVLVATIKLGMGYDKDDISFVIHFQMPRDIVSYYQQIGRAGRKLDKAYIFLLCGQEDHDILNYFIKTAFPAQSDMEQVLDCIREMNGASLNQICARLNIGRNKIEKALAFVQKDGYIFKEKSKYYQSVKRFYYDAEHYDAVTRLRYQEMEQMYRLTQTKECYSKFIANALDDKTAVECGHCSNCLHHSLIDDTVPFYISEIAAEYINGLTLPIKPRIRWATSEVTRATNIKFINEEGICLSKYGDPGFGELVKRDKYSSQKVFCDELVGKSAEVLRPWIQEHNIKVSTCVPSLRSNLVLDFAKRLAKRLGITFMELLQKRPSEQQKNMENSSHQCANAYRSFEVRPEMTMPDQILLIDDIVDSGWTMTVCGYRLMEAGCLKVYPFALADSSRKEG